MVRLPDIPTSTPGLLLRELATADAEAYFALIDRNRAHLGRFGDYPDERAADYAWVLAHLREDVGGTLRYGIRLRGKLIGRVDLVAVDPPSYATGFWLDQGHTGHGYATAAAAALHSYARDALGATDIVAGVTHGNDASRAVLDRLGFRPVADFDTYTRFHRQLQPRSSLRRRGDVLQGG